MGSARSSLTKGSGEGGSQTATSRPEQPSGSWVVIGCYASWSLHPSAVRSRTWRKKREVGRNLDLRGSIRGLLLRTWIRVLRLKATRLRKKPSMRRPMRWGSRPSGRRCGALSSFLLSGVGACSGQQIFPAEPEAVPLWLAPLFQHHPKCACRRTVTCLGEAQTQIVSDRRRLSALASFAACSFRTRASYNQPFRYRPTAVHERSRRFR